MNQLQSTSILNHSHLLEVVARLLNPNKEVQHSKIKTYRKVKELKDQKV